eukprot:g4979.t1
MKAGGFPKEDPSSKRKKKKRGLFRGRFKRLRFFRRKRRKDGEGGEGDHANSTMVKCAKASKWSYRFGYLLFNVTIIALVCALPDSKLWKRQFSDPTRPTTKTRLPDIARGDRFSEFWFCIIVQWLFYILVQGSNGGYLTKGV